MKNQCKPSDIDFIVGHGSATKKGDAAEVEAYQKTFSSSIPPLLSTKWLTGHLLGGSMGASFVLASQIIETQKIPSMPYELMVETRKTKLSRDSHFLIVGLGFNGQVACILGKGV